jgi:hypothetical protein
VTRDTRQKIGCLWAITGVLGLLVLGVGIIGIVDPTGSKQADDGDPFGEPPSRWWSATLTAVGLVLMLWPVPILLKDRPSADKPEDS